MTLLAPTAYATQPPGVEEGKAPATPATVPSATPKTEAPVTTVSGTTAAVLPVTGQSILWTIIIGVILLCGGIFLFLRTRKTHQEL
jgi:LPXTG-motif cell wall-anchored protein